MAKQHNVRGACQFIYVFCTNWFTPFLLYIYRKVDY